MARARRQRGYERLIPREVYEANEARRRARRARGVDSDDWTVANDDDDEENRDDDGHIV